MNDQVNREIVDNSYFLLQFPCGDDIVQEICQHGYGVTINAKIDIARSF